VISPYYDPMIAKIIVHGPARAAALSRLRAALRGTQVGGTVTNLSFLGALAAHEGFNSGDVDTGLIARDQATLVRAPEVTPAQIIAAGMVALGLDQPGLMAGFTLWRSLRRQVHLRCGKEDVTAHVRVDGPDQQRWDLDGSEYIVFRGAAGWMLDQTSLPDAQIDGDQITVFDAYGIGFERVDPLDRMTSAAGDGNVIEAPMPGLVKQVNAVPGQAVKQGDRLAILEAMKMEHALLAARDGVVAQVFAAMGDQVEAGAALVQLEPEEGAQP
jgi:3-methylcrotonyl-CoA carboxylase alpha subunit